jgi:predicted metal-binding membrane protein
VTTTSPLVVERRLLLGTLVVLAAAGWAVVVWQAAGMEMDEGMEGGIDLTMGMAAPLFVAMWLAMMAAMMLPASAPMILAFAMTQRKQSKPVPSWLFVAPYLAVWVVFGTIGYALAVWLDEAAEGSMWAMDNLPRVAGGLLVLAGVYQLTPLKRVCLSRCRTPLSFMMSYWQPGRRGAVEMALRHGLYCVGCCWVLFVLLIPLGVMNVAAMVAVAALVFAEKALPHGDRVATLVAPLLIAYGAVAMLIPSALPTTVT